jgi:hypothetical protein
MVSKGLRGALLIGVSGTILFYVLYVILWDSLRDILYMPIWETLLFSFIGFLIFGLGLWQIVEAGKPETKQTPS